jgi:hypothetical protein
MFTAIFRASSRVSSVNAMSVRYPSEADIAATVALPSLARPRLTGNFLLFVESEKSSSRYVVHHAVCPD